MVDLVDGVYATGFHLLGDEYMTRNKHQSINIIRNGLWAKESCTIVV